MAQQAGLSAVQFKDAVHQVQAQAASAVAVPALGTAFKQVGQHLRVKT